MRKPTLFLIASLGVISAYAQDSDERAPSPPVENLYFATDEFIYIPRNTLYVGFRVLSGAKASFSGSSRIWSQNVYVGDETTKVDYRTYHDGQVGVDSRTDADGNYILSADGLTNTWSYSSDTQAAEKNGYIAMHNYMAQVHDTEARSKDPDSVSGFELMITRDLKQIGSNSFFCLTGAIGMSDLKSIFSTKVPATLLTMTDYYSLHGAAAPGEGYSAPTSSSVTVTDADGNVQTVYVDNTVYISSSPDRRELTMTESSDLVTNRYKIKGAFVSMRVGPTFYFPVWGKLRASVSAGLAAVYAGTTFSVEESYEPTEDSDPITMEKSSIEKKLLPGYYVDANLEYWISERAGLYAGASYQSSGDFNQRIKTDHSEYVTKVEFKALSGLRAGLNLRY